MRDGEMMIVSMLTGATTTGGQRAGQRGTMWQGRGRDLTQAVHTLFIFKGGHSFGAEGLEDLEGVCLGRRVL